MTITNPDIRSSINSLSPGQLIDLWEVDCTDIGGSIYRFTPNTTESGTSVYLNGVEYLPLEVEIEGLEYKSDGQQPRPTIKIGNINQTFTAAIVSLDDMVGAKLTRRRTFRQFLDDGEEADSSVQFPADVFFVERKKSHNPLYIEWELVSIIDQAKVSIPRRQVIRDICTHRYREWDATTSTFDYTKATCPYTGDATYDEFGDATTSGGDACGKRVYDCELRYGDDEKPFYGFPGVARFGSPYR